MAQGKAFDLWWEGAEDLEAGNSSDFASWYEGAEVLYSDQDLIDVSRTVRLPVEYRGAVWRDPLLPWDIAGGFVQRNARLPVEWGGGLRRDARLPIEWGHTVHRTVRLPLEYAGLDPLALLLIWTEQRIISGFEVLLTWDEASEALEAALDLTWTEREDPAPDLVLRWTELPADVQTLFSRSVQKPRGRMDKSADGNTQSTA